MTQPNETSETSQTNELTNQSGSASTAERVRFEPAESEAGAPFWAATRERRLELPWCLDCGRPHWFPREVCPDCLGTRIEWRPASGRGVVYALSVQHRPGWPSLAERVPYAVALIDLDEGVRLMSNVVGTTPDGGDRIKVGQAVQVTWEELSDGRNLPQFEPCSGDETNP